nr:Chain C, Peptide MM91 [Homo sapiens]
KLVVGAVGV